MPLQSCSRGRAAPASDRSRGAHHRHGIHELHGERHHGSRRSRSRAQASGHVHRGRWIGRTAPPRLGDARQRRRRGDERPRIKYLGDAPCGRVVDHDRRRRPRDSDRQASGNQEERARSDLHRPPRRRQIRARQLQDGRRPSRRRRERRQRAVEGARRDRQARRRAVGNALQAGQACRRIEEAGACPRQRDHRLLSSRRRDFPEDRIRSGCD